MVVSQREIHHRPDDHLLVECYRALLDGVHPEDATLRRVQDRSRHHRAENAAVGDAEGSAGQVVQVDVAGARLFRIGDDRLFDFRKRQVVGVAHDRDDESLFGRDGHADVLPVVLHDVRAIDGSVDIGHRLERSDDRLHEQRHEAEFHAVCLDKFLLAFFAQIDDLAHVGLVECGQHRRLVLGADQPVGDGATHHAHAFAGDLANLRRGSHRCDRFVGDADVVVAGDGCVRCGGLCLLGCGQHVFLENAPALAGAGDRAQIDPEFLGVHLGRRSRQDFRRLAKRLVLGGGGWLDGSGSLRLAKRGFAPRGGRFVALRRGFAGFVDGCQHAADREFVPDVGLGGDHSGHLGRYFLRGLVGLDFADDVPRVAVVAGVLFPVGHVDGLDGFADGGDFDLSGHEIVLQGEGFLDELGLLEQVDGA